MKNFLFSVLLALLAQSVSAPVTAPKNTPELEFALQLKVTLDDAAGRRAQRARFSLLCTFDN